MTVDKQSNGRRIKVPESRVTWATSVPTLVFLGLCSQLRPDVRDRQTSDTRQKRIIA